MQIYTWWGGHNPPPPNLKTRSQLAEIGMRAIAPVGMIKTKKYNLGLYDPDDPTSTKAKRPATPAQLAALDKGRRSQQEKRDRKEREFFERGKRGAIAWAKAQLEQRGTITLLDTETTGLQAAEVIEIAIIDGWGNPLIDTLIRPSIAIEEQAIAIHGITPDMVQDAPTLGEIWESVEKAIADKTVLIYGANFDLRVIENSLRKPTEIRSVCLMERSAPYFGEWSKKYKSYKWQPLKGGNHRAMGDCLAALKLLEEMGSDRSL